MAEHQLDLLYSEADQNNDPIYVIAKTSDDAFRFIGRQIHGGDLSLVRAKYLIGVHCLHRHLQNGVEHIRIIFLNCASERDDYIKILDALKIFKFPEIIRDEF